MSNATKLGKAVTRDDVAADLAQFSNPTGLMARLEENGVLEVDVLGTATSYAFENGTFYRY